MPTKRKTEPPVSKSPRALAEAVRLRKAGSGLPWLREAKRQAEEMYAEARRMRSYVAAEKCLRAASLMATEIATLEAAKLTSKGTMSEEGFLAYLDEQLVKLPTPYLERAVTEYLTRHPGVRLQAADA